MKKIFILILILTLISGGSCTVHKDIDTFTTNKNILISKDFIIASESTDLKTSVRGTIFLYGLEGIPERAQIVAWVEVDPDDWGGVMFGIPREWIVTSITSSYPGEDSKRKPEEFIGIWNTQSNRYTFNKMIEIGTNRYSPTGGGTGIVIIQLEAYSELLKKNDELKVTVGVGSSEINGEKSISSDYKTIDVSYQ